MWAPGICRQAGGTPTGPRQLGTQKRCEEQARARGLSPRPLVKGPLRAESSWEPPLSKQLQKRLAARGTSLQLSASQAEPAFSGAPPPGAHHPLSFSGFTT